MGVVWGQDRIRRGVTLHEQKRRMGGLFARFRRAESNDDCGDTKSSDIKPKKTAADICGLEYTKFIIQKSGTHFTEVVSLKDEVSVDKVKPLREVCKNGDHYLAQYDIVLERGGPSGSLSFCSSHAPERTHFYIIKGNSCVEVDDLTSPEVMDMFSQRENIFTLHRQCQGGDFYLANRAGFYIIRSEDNTYLHVRDMSKYRPSFASRHKLHESFANGLYYFATEDYFYVLKENAVFGLVYHRTKDLRISDDDVLTVSPSIVKFMKNSLLDEGTVLECSYNIIILV